MRRTSIFGRAGVVVGQSTSPKKLIAKTYHTLACLSLGSAGTVAPTWSEGAAAGLAGCTPPTDLVLHLNTRIGACKGSFDTLTGPPTQVSHDGPCILPFVTLNSLDYVGAGASIFVSHFYR